MQIIQGGKSEKPVCPHKSTLLVEAWERAMTGARLTDNGCVHERPNPGYYRSTEGTDCDTPLGTIMEEIDWCQCGSPELAMLWLRDVLTFLRDRMTARGKLTDGSKREHAELFADVDAKEKVLFSCEGQKMAFYYTVELLGLTEHGSSVPGWLTDFGDAMLEALDELESIGALKS